MTNEIYNGLAIDDKTIDKLKPLSLADKIAYCRLQLLRYNDFNILIGRYLIDDIKANVSKTFSGAMIDASILLDNNFYNFVLLFKKQLDEMVVYERDYNLSHIAVETFKKIYLITINGKYIEIPQYTYLRLAVFLYYDYTQDLKKNLSMIKETYDELSCQLYSHATPTLINAGMKKPQLASCFLLSQEDDLVNIANNIKYMMIISKYSGGLGLEISGLRHSSINHQLDGNGLKSWLPIYNAVINAVNQGGKRNGSCAIYVDIWHKDIFDVLDSRRLDLGGDVMAKTPYLFYGILISNLFMKRVINDEQWTLFCPNLAKGLPTLYGKEFEKKYIEYENTIKGEKVAASDLFYRIIENITITGMPYILNKDAMNYKSNQKNLGTIRTSNLCAEIIEYTDSQNIATCNLASICLDKCVADENVNYSLIQKIIIKLVKNLNIVIDKNYYPSEIPQIKSSNLRDRPLGIGVQGFADMLCLMDITWKEEEKIKELNHYVFETIYWSALYASYEYVIPGRNYMQFSMYIEPKSRYKYPLIYKPTKNKLVYKSFSGSPISKGLFQFDLWNEPIESWKYPPMHDWEYLRDKITDYGIGNSQLIALMPTVTTSLITGANESFEPFSGLYYDKGTNSGNYLHINKYLINDMKLIGLWNEDTINQIIQSNDSLSLVNCPQRLKDKYMTAYEISKKFQILLAKERGKFVCQSQSLNHYIDTQNTSIVSLLASIFKYGYECGLKTISYYVRLKSVVKPLSVTLKNNCQSCQ